MRRTDPAEPVLAKSQEQIDEFCAYCQRNGRFAFDTEFVTEDRYETEVCLLQLATAQDVLLVDPFEGLNLEPIWNLVCEDATETVVHAGQEDLALCMQHTGKVPRRVFDVQLAAGLIGWEYPISLQKLVQAVRHVRLHKSKTLTDWRKRPLTLSQLRYAAEDVSHLLLIRDHIGDRLGERERLEWAAEEFKTLEDPVLYRRVEEDRLMHFKGAGALKGAQLAILKEVLDWREALARTRNRPARTVIKDHILIEVAKHGLESFGDIRELRGLNLADRDVHALGKVVQAAALLPPDRWPQSREREFESPAEEVLIPLLTAVLRSFSRRHGVAYGLLATKRSLRQLIRFVIEGSASHLKSDITLMTGWRGRFVGQLLLEILSGRSGLRVRTDHDEAIIDIAPSAERKAKSSP
ncbi:MAG: HRDC domain-containing protein [Planctomycetota bacterium]